MQLHQTLATLNFRRLRYMVGLLMQHVSEAKYLGLTLDKNLNISITYAKWPMLH